MRDWKVDHGDIRADAGVEGAATYGGRDRDRVKQGNVDAGAIEAEVTPATDRLSFAIE